MRTGSCGGARPACPRSIAAALALSRTRAPPGCGRRGTVSCGWSSATRPRAPWPRRTARMQKARPDPLSERERHLALVAHDACEVEAEQREHRIGDAADLLLHVVLVVERMGARRRRLRAG